jgi:hypothetical protein
VFPQQLECPHFVEPQIILRGKYTHNNANGKGSDCHPQHECMQRRALRCTSHFHTDCCGPFAVSLRAGALVGFAQSDHLANEVAQMRFCVCCGERLAWSRHRVRASCLLAIERRWLCLLLFRSRLIEFYLGLCGATGGRFRLWYNSQFEPERSEPR